MSRIVSNPSLTRSRTHVGSKQSNQSTQRIYRILYKNIQTPHLAEQACHCSDQSGRAALILCQGSSSENQSSQDEGIQIDIAVSGMMCDGCTSRIEEELGKKDSVTSVHADLDNGMVTVTVSVENFGDAAQCMESLVHDINEMGFEARPTL